MKVGKLRLVGRESWLGLAWNVLVDVAVNDADGPKNWNYNSG